MGGTLSRSARISLKIAIASATRPASVRWHYSQLMEPAIATLLQRLVEGPSFLLLGQALDDPAVPVPHSALSGPPRRKPVLG